MRDRLERIWDLVRDPYWRADHPEVTAALLAVVTGTIGLWFAWLQRKIINGGGS